MNPVPQLALVRAAIGLTGAATRAAGSATGELIDAAGASFKEIFSQSPPAAAPPELSESAVTQQLQNARAQLLTAVRAALAHAGIDLAQNPAVELVIDANGQTTIGQGHPLQGTLAMVLQNDEAVAAAASRLAILRSAHAVQPETLTLTGAS